MKHPTVDPHGSPIPNAHGEVPVLNYIKLSEAELKISYRFMAVGSSDDRFLRHIDHLGLKLGDKVEVLEIMEFDHSLNVRINDEKFLSLSPKISSNLRVSPL